MVIKGAMSLIVIAAIIWVFWMSAQWLINRNKRGN